MAAGFARAREARAALRAISSDPACGPAVLADPAALANLLADYLPGAPRETGLLLAASRAGVASHLREHVAAGMDPATAIRIVAAQLASATAYSAEACTWAAGEFAIGLGLTSVDAMPEPAWPGGDAQSADQRTPKVGPDESRTDPGPTLELTTIVEAGKTKAGRAQVAVASAIAVVVLAGGTATALALAHEPARHPSSAGGQNSPPGPRTTQPPTPTGKRTPVADASPWTSPTITIAPASLGAVTIGMTLARASAAAGEPLEEVGDGFAYPDGGSSSSLFVGGTPVVRCLGASLAGYGPGVVTEQGFQLGGTLAELKATYGASLAFVPAPASGYYPVSGYVVAYPEGNLAFIVSKGIVTKIEAGPGVRPSSCDE